MYNIFFYIFHDRIGTEAILHSSIYSKYHFRTLEFTANWKEPQAKQSNIQTELISWLYIFVHFRKRCIAQPCRLIRELSLCHITLSQQKQKC